MRHRLDTDTGPTNAQLDAIEASDRLTCGLCRYSTRILRGPQARAHAWQRLQDHALMTHDIHTHPSSATGDHRSIVHLDPATFHAVDDITDDDPPTYAAETPRPDLVAFVSTITPESSR